MSVRFQKPMYFLQYKGYVDLYGDALITSQTFFHRRGEGKLGKMLGLKANKESTIDLEKFILVR